MVSPEERTQIFRWTHLVTVGADRMRSRGDEALALTPGDGRAVDWFDGRAVDNFFMCVCSCVCACVLPCMYVCVCVRCTTAPVRLV